jgi:hypothetical protein
MPMYTSLDLKKETNSALLLKQIERQNLIVTQSDYLYDEVIEYFRRKEGKDMVGRIRKYLLTIPNNEYAANLLLALKTCEDYLRLEFTSSFSEVSCTGRKID